PRYVPATRSTGPFPRPPLARAIPPKVRYRRLMRIERLLDQLACEAIRETTGQDAPALLRPTTDPRHGDYQLNGAMALGKALGKKPRDVAEPVAAKLQRHPAIERAEVAGPGF